MRTRHLPMNDLESHFKQVIIRSIQDWIGYHLSQALLIFLDILVTAWGAILISVTLILMFFEFILSQHSKVVIILQLVIVGQGHITRENTYEEAYGQWVKVSKQTLRKIQGKNAETYN